MPNTVDLQMHSNYSDGTLSPKELTRECKKAGLKMVSLTDHDTVAGLKEAVAESEKLGIEFVPGIEISAEQRGESIHILGHYIDPKNGKLLKKLEYYRKQRRARAERIVAKLRPLGFKIDTEFFKKSQGTIGRPHIARAVLDNPANKGMLAGTETVGDFIRAWIVPGKPVYVSREKLSVKQAIDLIHKAGGEAVWAHPGYTFDDLAKIERLAKEFKGYGLDGLETRYFSYTEVQAAFLDNLADRLELKKTSGSDFHGGSHPARLGKF